MDQDFVIWIIWLENVLHENNIWIAWGSFISCSVYPKWFMNIALTKNDNFHCNYNNTSHAYCLRTNTNNVQLHNYAIVHYTFVRKMFTKYSIERIFTTLCVYYLFYICMWVRTHNIYLVKGNIWHRQKSITRVGAIAQKGSQSNDWYCNKKENLSWISFITALYVLEMQWILKKCNIYYSTVMNSF